MENILRTQDPDIFVTKGKRPRWYFRPFVDTFDQNGNPTRKQVRVYLGSVSRVGKREAISKKNEALAHINRSGVVLQSQLKFGELLEFYLTNFVRVPEKVAATTRNKYETHIDNHIRDAWQSRQLGEIRGLEIDQWLQEKAKPRIVQKGETQKIVPGLSWHTREDLRNIMSGIFTKAIEWGIWKGDNPVAHVSTGRKKLVREKVKLTDEETVQLLESLPVAVRLICMVALFCTLRISEIMGMRWRNVDLVNGVLRVRERFSRGDLDTVKTAGSERDVQLGLLVEALREMFPGAGHEDDFVFNVETYVGHDRKPRITRDDRSINQYFLRPAAKALGVYRTGFGFHAFRREAVTNIARDAGAVQAMLAAGHRKLDMTMLYALNDTAQQKQAVEASQKRLFGGKVIVFQKKVG